MAAIVAEVEALFGRDVGVAQGAAERVARALERAPITAVVGLDRALRDGGRAGAWTVRYRMDDRYRYYRRR